MTKSHSGAVETRTFAPPQAFSRDAKIDSMAKYEELCAQARDNYPEYWARLAREHIEWKTPFQKVLNQENAPFYRWFEDGTLNVSYNCLDRHINAGLGARTAVMFESDRGEQKNISYQELLERVCAFANALKSMGIKKNDRVILYMPMGIEGVVAMQACARIGAIHSVVFGGFSAKSLQERIIDTSAVAVITADQQLRGGKVLPLKVTVDEALKGTDSVRNVIVFQLTGNDIHMEPERDVWWHHIIAGQAVECEPEWVSAEHPLFILYTSGSTGKPKGIQHSSGGYLLWAKVTTDWVFDIKASDVFWCTADIGWITGHSYVCYGPLANGATQVIFEGIPTYPDASRFWQIIEKYKVTTFYTAPTAIRALIKAAESNPNVHPKHFDLSSLRLLGSVGEPINPEAWMWFYENIGRKNCPIVDTFWQTETGGHIISPLPGATIAIPGFCTLPLPGIDAAVVDEAGHEVENGKSGFVVIKKPWPSMLRTIWNDDERFKKTYFPEELGGSLYLAGDGAVRQADNGYFMITGRIDDTLNVSGHLMGTMEIESALVAHPKVAEAAVVGRPDAVKGEAICAFVVLTESIPESKEDKERVAETLRMWVAKQIGAIAKPSDIKFGDTLPKTRSGKIMRRLLRTIARGEEITQEVSTLENPASLEQFKA